MMNQIRPIAALMLLVATVWAAGCSEPKVDPEWRRDKEAELTVERFRKADPSLARFFDGSAGYVVLPNVAKAGFGFGGAFGKGVVYQDNRIIGTTTMSSGSFGAQIGGQSYSEIIFFQWPQELEVFKQGGWQIDVTASAVVANAGAAANVDYSNGVAVFVVGQEGAMAEASIGGQHFSYTPR